MKSCRIIFLLLFASAHVVHTMDDDPRRTALVAYFLAHPPSTMSDAVLDGIQALYFRLDPSVYADTDGELYRSDDELGTDPYSYARLRHNGQLSQPPLPVNSNGHTSITLPQSSVTQDGQSNMPNITAGAAQKASSVLSILLCHEKLT
jgi:hypothetical protein